MLYPPAAAMTNAKNRQPDMPSPRAIWVVLILALAAVAPAPAATTDCADVDSALAYWRPIREEPEQAGLAYDRLALELVACLNSSNAELRDEIGYTLFSTWLRGDRLSDATRRLLLKKLQDMMNTSPEMAAGSESFGRSFAALVLAELMRSDAYQPFLDESERHTLLGDALRALDREKDFRGLTAEHGWVHPVAHIADLLWRFALHPDTDADEAWIVLDGLRVKVSTTEAAYTFNEGDRLARVAGAIIARRLLPADRILAWLAFFESPASMADWPAAFQSPEGMTELHNTKQFVRSLSDQIAANDIDPRITRSLSALVQEFTDLI